jgi:hypothetical protein
MVVAATGMAGAGHHVGGWGMATAAVAAAGSGTGTSAVVLVVVGTGTGILGAAASGTATVAAAATVNGTGTTVLATGGRARRHPGEERVGCVSGCVRAQASTCIGGWSVLTMCILVQRVEAGMQYCCDVHPN